MRKITLPLTSIQVSIQQPDGSIKTEEKTAGWLLAQVLPSADLTFAQLARRMPIYDRLMNGKHQILLEEDDWEELTERINAQVGIAFHKDTLAICQAALDAQEVEVEEKAKPRSGKFATPKEIRS